MYLQLPDNEAGIAMAIALKKSGLAIDVAEINTSLQLASVDERMKWTLDCLNKKGVIQNGYDYVWIMQYIHEKHIPSCKLQFKSMNSFHDYIAVYMQQTNIAGLSTLYEYRSYVNGRYPEWTFSDDDDSLERLRRVNVAKRFSILFTQGR